jgi:hypothetical protein
MVPLRVSVNDSFVLNTDFLRCQILWGREVYPRGFNNASISNATTAKAFSVLLWGGFCQRLILVYKPSENAISLKNKVKKQQQKNRISCCVISVVSF